MRYLPLLLLIMALPVHGAVGGTTLQPAVENSWVKLMRTDPTLGRYPTYVNQKAHPRYTIMISCIAGEEPTTMIFLHDRNPDQKPFDWADAHINGIPAELSTANGDAGAVFFDVKEGTNAAAIKSSENFTMSFITGGEKLVIETPRGLLGEITNTAFANVCGE